MTINLWAELFFHMNGFDLEANDNSEMPILVMLPSIRLGIMMVLRRFHSKQNEVLTFLNNSN